MGLQQLVKAVGQHVGFNDDAKNDIPRFVVPVLAFIAVVNRLVLVGLARAKWTIILSERQR